jgi:hypothetical protein
MLGGGQLAAPPGIAGPDDDSAGWRCAANGLAGGGLSALNEVAVRIWSHPGAKERASAEGPLPGGGRSTVLAVTSSLSVSSPITRPSNLADGEG